jgi:hypothetical protein
MHHHRGPGGASELRRDRTRHSSVMHMLKLGNPERLASLGSEVFESSNSAYITG